MILTFMMLLFACSSSEKDPRTISKSDLETAVPKKDIGTLCSGMRSPDPELQQYATENIRIFDAEKITECMGRSVVDMEQKQFREGVLLGLKGEERNAVASVVVDKLQDSNLTNRTKAIFLLGEVTAPVVNKTLLAVAENPNDDAEIRAVAVRAIGGYSQNFENIAQLFEDKATPVRVAAVEMLGRHRNEKSAKSLLQEGTTDSNEEVRAAAMLAYYSYVGLKAEELMCTTMMTDESPKVRAAAITALRKTTSVNAIRCLRERALTLESDRDVRAAILDSLRMADKEAETPAYTVLCDAIPFWLRSYVTDKLPEEDPATDIVKIQNDEDYPRSKECFAKAYENRKGYTCHAEKYISWFYKQVSGLENLYVPKCPGDIE